MMRQYLKIPPGDAINSLGDKFPVDRCLCLIGSDYKDYGIVRRATGGVSDGLVLQRNAYCAEGPAPAPGTEYAPDKVAFSANVHKAHSGYEGIVNSYESWENIHRFLFGDVRASIGLAELGLATPEPTTANERVYYDIEFMFSVRGTNTPMHWRAQMPCENALRREREDMFQATIGLHTAFLNTALRLEIPAGADPSEGVNVRDSDGTTRRVSRYLYFKMNLRVVEYRAREAGGALTFIKQHLGIDSHYDGTQVYGEGLEVRVDAETYDVQYRWFSEPNPDPVAMSPWQVVTDKTPTPDGMKYRFDLRQGGALTGKFVIQAQKWQPDLWQKVALAAG